MLLCFLRRLDVISSHEGLGDAHHLTAVPLEFLDEREDLVLDLGAAEV